MSGIVGVVNTDGAPIDPSLLTAMTEALRFRGPFWADTFNLYSLGASYPGITNAYLQPDYDLCANAVDANYCKYGWGSLHPGGINWLFGDGSVRNITTDINLTIFHRSNGFNLAFLENSQEFNLKGG